MGSSESQLIKQGGCKWQAQLSDSTLLFDVSIPGTHNRCALYGVPILDYGKCQSKDLPDQYNMGIRYVDIRCRPFENNLTIHHEQIYQNKSFGQVLQETKTFLNNNPSEFIVMNIQKEYTSEKCTKAPTEILKSYLENYEDMFYNYKSDKKDNPPVGEIRSKVFIIYSGWGGTGGLSWSLISRQDEYDVPTIHEIAKKKDLIRHHFKEYQQFSTHKKLSINMCSGVGILCTAITVASATNSVVGEFTQNENGLGIVGMDFQTDEVVWSIILSNFQLRCNIKHRTTGKYFGNLGEIFQGEPCGWLNAQPSFHFIHGGNK